MPELRLIPIGSVYESDQQAFASAERLLQNGFDDSDISVVSPSTIRDTRPELFEADTLGALALLVKRVHDSADVPDRQALVYARNLQQGRTVLLFTPPFGRANRAEALLRETGRVDIGPLPPPEFHTWLQAAPFSAWLGLPVLSTGRSRLARPFGDPLTDSDFLPSRFFGRLLSDNPTPLSSVTGMKVLSDNPMPLSSKFGMRVLSDNPTPLSSAVGLPTLSEERPAGKTHSFGLPLLSRNNPTPLSSLLGLSVLTRDQRGKAKIV